MKTTVKFNPVHRSLELFGKYYGMKRHRVLMSLKRLQTPLTHS